MRVKVRDVWVMVVRNVWVMGVGDMGERGG